MIRSSLLLLYIFVNSSSSKETCRSANIPSFSLRNARSFAASLVVCLSFSQLQLPWAAARNLPEDFGSSFIRSGTPQALIPIADMAASIKAASKALPDINACDSILQASTAFKSEKEFKKIFDAYSDKVSYKQRYLDQNAFLVYYTAGFDGVGRPRIDSDDAETTRTSLQFGFRNDAWVAVDEAVADAHFIAASLSKGNGVSLEDTKDLKTALEAADKAFDNYIQLAIKSE